jgi:S-adenosyl methyltransferase
VTEPGLGGGAGEAFDVDPGSAYPARIFNYLIGGNDHFAADREAAHHLYGQLPGGLDTARTIARAVYDFLVDAVRYLAAEAGIRQFVQFGSVVRVLANVHDVAQEIAPDARVVYVVNDAVVLAHAHELRASSPEGVTSIVHGDLRDLPGLMREVRLTLDLTQPVAVIVQGVLHYMGGDDDPRAFVTQVVDLIAPGSYLVVTHAASDLGDAQIMEAAKRQEELTRAMRWRMIPRDHDEIAQLLDGLEFVGPGLVAVDQWRPSPADPPPPSAALLPWYGAIARKP